MNQPTLAVLTARFLARPAEVDTASAVEPHEMPAGFATEPRTAWTEATAVAKLLGMKDFAAKSPVDWAGYVRQSTTADYLPMAIGHFPQQVRDVSVLIEKKGNATHSESRGWTIAAGQATFANQLLAAASERMAENFDEAKRHLDAAEPLATDAIQKSLLTNERAVLAWQRGDRAAAETLWNSQPASGPVAFNCGIAALAAGRKADAANWLTTAVQQLPESSGWHHLAQLYLALAG